MALKLLPFKAKVKGHFQALILQQPNDDAVVQSAYYDRLSVCVLHCAFSASWCNIAVCYACKSNRNLWMTFQLVQAPSPSLIVIIIISVRKVMV